MNKISKEDFEKNLDSILEQTILYNTPTLITTDYGNAVLISEDDYYILKMVLDSGDTFDEYIISELIKEGFSEDNFLKEFKVRQNKVRQAVKKLKSDAEKVATNEGEYFTYGEVFD